MWAHVFDVRWLVCPVVPGQLNQSEGNVCVYGCICVGDLHRVAVLYWPRCFNSNQMSGTSNNQHNEDVKLLLCCDRWVFTECLCGLYSQRVVPNTVISPHRGHLKVPSAICRNTFFSGGVWSNLIVIWITVVQIWKFDSNLNGIYHITWNIALEQFTVKKKSEQQSKFC